MDYAAEIVDEIVYNIFGCYFFYAKYVCLKTEIAHYLEVEPMNWSFPSDSVIRDGNWTQV